jgi:hypothetical protein
MATGIEPGCYTVAMRELAKRIGWRGFGALVGGVGVVLLGQLYSTIGGS